MPYVMSSRVAWTIMIALKLVSIAKCCCLYILTSVRLLAVSHGGSFVGGRCTGPR